MSFFFLVCVLSHISSTSWNSQSITTVSSADSPLFSIFSLRSLRAWWDRYTGVMACCCFPWISFLFVSSGQWVTTSRSFWARHSIGWTFTVKSPFPFLESSSNPLFCNCSFTLSSSVSSSSPSLGFCTSCFEAQASVHSITTLGGGNELELTGPEKVAEFEPSASPLCCFGLTPSLRSPVSQRWTSFLSSSWSFGLAWLPLTWNLFALSPPAPPSAASPSGLGLSLPLPRPFGLSLKSLDPKGSLRNCLKAERYRLFRR